MAQTRHRAHCRFGAAIHRVGFALALASMLGSTIACAARVAEPPTASSTPPSKPNPQPIIRSVPKHEPRDRAPSPSKVRAARAHLSQGGAGGQELRCGPYLLWTDVREPRRLAACARIGERLDAAYFERYGVRPQGTPRTGIVLFARLADYRAFVHQDGRLAAGYAGFASDADGLVYLHANDPLPRTIATLAHELSHLVERRVFPRGLPPWLSEGLAEGMGQSAREEGFLPLATTPLDDSAIRRLRNALKAQEAGDLARLLGLSRSAFDRGVRSFDYEESALLVRFLASDPRYVERFRAELARLAAGERYEAERFLNGWSGDLKRDLERWIGKPKGRS